MELKNLIENVSDMLWITVTEAEDAIRGCFLQEDPFNALSDFLGLYNTELIFEIFQHKDQFIGSDWEIKKAAYIEHVIPEVSPATSTLPLISTSILGENQKYFNYKEFNVVQSAVFEDVYKKDGNILVSAPTGAGKTDIAILSILRAFSHGNSLVVYIVPMKALATEVFTKLTKMFPQYKVIEYTGDTDIESKIIKTANIVVCTPEKFDVSTRRQSSIFTNIRLVIIDEIHLLDDDRGPVLESIVVRLFRNSERFQCPTRILGISATLPNYYDVADFIKAEYVHFFDSHYRPVPLKMTITGFTSGSSYVDEIEYLKNTVQMFVDNNKQILVFVHSRLKTMKTARILCKKLQIQTSLITTKLRGELSDILLKGIGIHHAGLSKEDRHETERLFRENKIKILVCTSTLAWGVNLPAYGVIIYGSTFYNPEKGKYDDLGILDILQIFGRAGRPQYDSKGEAVLITKSNKIDHYIKLLKRNTEIESKMLFSVPECINAEIYLNNIRNMCDALHWLRNTFLCTRMIKNPMMYGIFNEDLGLEEQALSEYVYLTIKLLESCHMANIKRVDSNYNTWIFTPTFYGQMASIYYLKHETISKWIEGIPHLNSDLSIIELLISSEFDTLGVRNDEDGVLNGLYQNLLEDGLVDFEFDGSLNSKLLILIFAYFNFRTITMFSLICDTTYLIDNLKRIVSAFKEMLLYGEYYEMYHRILMIQKNINRGTPTKRDKIGIQNSKIPEFKVDFHRINLYYVQISLNIPEDSKYSVVVSHKSKIQYAFEVYGQSKTIFQYLPDKMNISLFSMTGRLIFETKVKEISLLSLGAFLKFGTHSCDSMFNMYGPRTECLHFTSRTDLDEITSKFDKFSIDSAKASNILDETYNNVFTSTFNLRFKFFDIPSMHFNENLKIMNNLIYQMNLTDAVIICPTLFDARETLQFLNIKATLHGMEDKTKKSLHKKNAYNNLVVAFDKFKPTKNIKTVVFKGITNGHEMYPVHEIFKIGDNRNVIVLDFHRNYSFLKYLTSNSNL